MCCERVQVLSGVPMATARITYHRQQWEVESGFTVRETLVKIGLDPEQVVPLRKATLHFPLLTMIGYSCRGHWYPRLFLYTLTTHPV